MEVLPIYKSIIELGILVVISGVFIVQQQKLFNKVFELQERTLKALSMLNTDKAKGKGLELLLNLKIKELRWDLENIVVEYIKSNNIKENYEIIKRELQVLLEEKHQEVFSSLKGIVEHTVLKIFMLSIRDELSKMMPEIINVFENLKENGQNNKSLYSQARRNVDSAFDNFENVMLKKNIDLIN